MKTEITIARHHTIPGLIIASIWYDGQRIASICGIEGPGIRITSEYSIEVGQVKKVESSKQSLKVLEVRVN
jgi:hypothetical protein